MAPSRTPRRQPAKGRSLGSLAALSGAAARLRKAKTASQSGKAAKLRDSSVRSALDRKLIDPTEDDLFPTVPIVRKDRNGNVVSVSDTKNGVQTGQLAEEAARIAEAKRAKRALNDGKKSGGHSVPEKDNSGMDTVDNPTSAASSLAALSEQRSSRQQKYEVEKRELQETLDGIADLEWK